MQKENLVTFKGEIDGVLIKLDSNAPFDNVLIALKQKLDTGKKFFANAKITFRFKGRELSKTEKEQIIELLTNLNIVDIVFLHPFEETEEDKKKAQRQENNVPSLHPASNTIVKSMKDNPKPKKLNTSDTYYFYGILRSGQEIIHDGSVVVLGDVNPGAVVRAGENIIIMGNLKGRAFSGLDRKKNKSFIIAQGMNPEQIGIGAYVANSPKEKNTLSTTPEIAYASENRIYVEEIDFKSLQNMVE